MPTQDHLRTILLELKGTLGRSMSESADQLVEAILDAPRVYVSGAGRSGYMMRCFAMRLMHLGLDVSVSGETTTGEIRADDLLLIGSGSGATGSLVNHAERANEIGARVGLVTINADSEIGRLADIVLPIPAPSPKLTEDNGNRSSQPMGALFEQCLLLTLEAIVMELMIRTGQSEDDMFRRHANLE